MALSSGLVLLQTLLLFGGWSDLPLCPMGYIVLRDAITLQAHLPGFSTLSLGSCPVLRAREGDTVLSVLSMGL